MDLSNKEIILLNGTIKRNEMEIERLQKEINRITKAFFDLQKFYDVEKSERLTYKNKLIELGVVLL